MKNKTKKINARKVLVLMLVAATCFMFKPAQAQVTTALGLNYVFGGWSNYDMPQLMIKVPIGNSAAFRLRAGAYGYSRTEMFEFYENRDYINHSDWPNKIDDEVRREENDFDFTVVPGIEFRKQINNNNLFYYGLDIGFTSESDKYYNRSFSQSYNAGTNESTITRVYETYDVYKSSTITPMVFLGYQRSIGGGFSLMIETAVGPELRTQTRMYERMEFDWDGGTMDFEVDENNTYEFENTDPNKNNWLSFEPYVDLYLAYTFGSNE
ncbi:MAG: hypothetical protein JXR19_01640 [Bacteroidia bacterium]